METILLLVILICCLVLAYFFIFYSITQGTCESFYKEVDTTLKNFAFYKLMVIWKEGNESFGAYLRSLDEPKVGKIIPILVRKKTHTVLSATFIITPTLLIVGSAFLYVFVRLGLI